MKPPFTPSILAENARRNAALAEPYDPATGTGCAGDRVAVTRDGKVLHLPRAMVDDPVYPTVLGRAEAFAQLRIRHDFEYWLLVATRIEDKISGCLVPFVANRPQRMVIRALEEQRLAGRPQRLLILKARQWGASTLALHYQAWLQLVRDHCRHSVICGHVKDAAANVRAMYSAILARYPESLWVEECKPAMKACEGMANTRIIPGRDCRVTVTSCINSNATRGQNYSIAHFTEVAFWRESATTDPERVMRSIVSGIACAPGTCIISESTANGTGNFFYREWSRSRKGESDFTPLFVSWKDCEIYRQEVIDPESFWESMDDYEYDLWERHGCTLEAVNWYHQRRRSYPEHYLMKSEFPTTAEEAFADASNAVFAPDDVARVAACCVEAPLRGEVAGVAATGPDALRNVEFHPSPSGLTDIWAQPVAGAPENRYIVAADIGGRSEKSDWSVLTVIDRHPEQPAATRRPEVVATWRGHTDMDLLAWKAAALARYYCGALLVIESNSLDSASDEAGPYLLSTISNHYYNLYRRTVTDPLGSQSMVPGFHTNRRSKSAIISTMIAHVRDGTYIERDARVIPELMDYQRSPRGGYGARRGSHDDMLMTRAIALYIDEQHYLPRG